MLKWGPLTNWDHNIMQIMPHVADIAKLDEFEAVSAWLLTNIAESDYTWKSYRFFFRNQDDYMLFTMRWG